MNNRELYSVAAHFRSERQAHAHFCSAVAYLRSKLLVSERAAAHLFLRDLSYWVGYFTEAQCARVQRLFRISRNRPEIGRGGDYYGRSHADDHPWAEALPGIVPRKLLFPILSGAIDPDQDVLERRELRDAMIAEGRALGKTSIEIDAALQKVKL